MHGPGWPSPPRKVIALVIMRFIYDFGYQQRPQNEKLCLFPADKREISNREEDMKIELSKPFFP